MNALNLLDTAPLWAELRGDALHVFNGKDGAELPLTLDADGRPDATTRASVVAALGRLAPRRPWQARGVLWCAVPARGVVLRRVRVPTTGREALRSVLRLQVEAAFPLPPDELAWGWFEDGEPVIAGVRELTIAAVRKEPPEQWSEVFASAGLQTVFTLASVARTVPQQRGRESFAALDLSARTAELATFQGGVPGSVRSLPWTLDQLADAAARELGWPRTGFDQACLSPRDSLADPARRTALADAWATAATPLAEAVLAARPGNSIFVTGTGPWLPLLVQALETKLAPLLVVTNTATTVVLGRTDAVAGLQGLARQPGAGLPLRLEPPNTAAVTGQGGLPGVPWKWVARAAALLLAVLLFPYLEAFVGGPVITRRLAALKQDRARLGEIDRRLDFLGHLAAHQAPYLDAAFVIANAAPPGTKLDSLTLNRRGEVSLGGYAQPPPLAIEFRTKLIDSKFFSSVVVEELTPVQNNQRVNFRMTAQWKGPAEREALQLGPVLPEPPKTNAPAGGTNAPAKVSATNAPVAGTNNPAANPARPN